MLVRLVSVDLHTFGPDALTAVRLIEHQANADQAAEVRPQLVEQVPAAVQGAPAPGEQWSDTAEWLNTVTPGSERGDLKRACFALICIQWCDVEQTDGNGEDAECGHLIWSCQLVHLVLGCQSYISVLGPT